MAFLYRVAWDGVAFSSCLWTTALELVFELTLFRSWNHPFGTSDLTSHFTDEKTKVHWGEVTCCRSDSYEIEPRMKAFAHGIEGFYCTGTSGSLAKHRHSRRGCQQPALKEARGPGILSFELHLKKIWGLQRSAVLVPHDTQDSQVTAGYVQPLLTCCLSPTSTPVGSATEERKALRPSILRLHIHTQGGLVWFGVACTEVSSRLFYARYLQIQKTKGKL